MHGKITTVARANGRSKQILYAILQRATGLETVYKLTVMFSYNFKST